ncbi:hypothetical protein H4R35_003324 [Dimargaris xerosporica]|nr:hypothetical protein H4R35_003324 [Dimargaris xerosporica]
MSSPIPPTDGAVTTAVDYLHAQAQLEKEAEEVLPGKFDHCTYGLGYIHQPVYVCLTCMRHHQETSKPIATQPVAAPQVSIPLHSTVGPAAGGSRNKDIATPIGPTPSKLAKLVQGLDLASAAGICYSCSIACHASHEVIELFNKRHFRCDCGSRRMAPSQCSLEPKPTITNDGNQYSHNFIGRYCWCDQLYDPSVEDRVMFQCAVCCDWFHDTCIGQLPPGSEFDEFICDRCTTAYPILLQNCQSKLIQAGQVDPATHKVIAFKAQGSETASPTTTPTAEASNGTQDDDPANDTDERPAKRSRPDPATGRNASPNRLRCKLSEVTAASNPYIHPNVLFCRDGWRQDLCRCAACFAKLQKYGLAFILDEDDPHVPEKDTDSATSLFDCGMKALSSLDHVEAMEGIRAYTRFRDELKAYLQPFAESGKVVTDHDIRAFFEARKSSLP